MEATITVTYKMILIAAGRGSLPGDDPHLCSYKQPTGGPISSQRPALGHQRQRQLPLLHPQMRTPPATYPVRRESSRLAKALR